MAQTVSGASKMKATMIKRFGSEEAWRDWMRQNARKAGQASRTGGFASDVKGKDGLSGRERAKIAGSKGGSRRWKNAV